LHVGYALHDQSSVMTYLEASINLKMVQITRVSSIV
jgi:hypothetical protein